MSYASELESLQSTYQWALKVPVATLSSFAAASFGCPLIVSGSGGSLSAANMAALLHQLTGAVARAVTPLELVSTPEMIQESNVLVISAGGNNSDVIFAHEFAATHNARRLMACCMRLESRLRQSTNKFRFSDYLGLELPTGKDGFLATNSLLGFVVILIRAYGVLLPKVDTLSQGIPSVQQVCDQLQPCAQSIIARGTWNVLYGKWGFPAALDLESKCTEAALCNIQLADFRNFAHGRHHWLAKRADESGVVALISPDEKYIADKILGLLPDRVPVLRLETDSRGPVSTVMFLVMVLHLVHLKGLAQKINLSRPGVPSFGRRVYALRIPKRKYVMPLQKGLDRRGTAAIQRKIGRQLTSYVLPKQVAYWVKSYRTYVRRLERAVFGAIVLDYDGTLCDSRERYRGVSEEIKRELMKLLSCGALVGIATGRGRSVRKDLQRIIPEKYWKQVLIGYYNGSDIGLLGDAERPDTERDMARELAVISHTLENHWELGQIARFECRPRQITVEPTSMSSRERTTEIVRDVVSMARFQGVQALESGHSVDIVAAGVTKLEIVNACSKLAEGNRRSGNVLCIGDKGKWPGNDYELLSSPYSLCVDVVSADPMSCWDISRPGSRGVQATLEYMRCLSVSGSGELTFSLRGGGR